MRSMVEGYAKETPDIPSAQDHPSTTAFGGGPPPLAGEDLG
jgi:hypothetical protein